MKFDMNLQMKMGQSLIMTPQLQQAIRLLQLSRYDLEKLIDQSLVENPALEIVDNSIQEAAEVKAEEDSVPDHDVEVPETPSNEIEDVQDNDWLDYIESGSGQIAERNHSSGESEDQKVLDNILSERESLTQMLLNQIDLIAEDEAEAEIMELIVSNLNQDGYLNLNLRELIAMENTIRDYISKKIKKNEVPTVNSIRRAMFDTKYKDGGAQKKITAKLFTDLPDDLKEEMEEQLQQAEFSSDPSDVTDDECAVLDSILQKIQTFEPSGVGARSLSECLMIQLLSLTEQNQLAISILVNDFDSFMKNDIVRLHRKYKTTPEAVFDACRLIRDMEPKPGRQYSHEETQYIIPDVFIFKRNGEYFVTLNDDTLPKLRVSPKYIEMFKQQQILNARKKEERKKNKDSDQEEDLTEAYINEKIKAGEWLMKSIDQRQRTIYKVSQCILDRQKSFFEEGIDALKPMVLKDIAEDIDVHESTVSRITNNKYMHTPQGIFELKYFFTSGIAQDDGDSVSSKKIKDIIEKMIQNENPKKPYTDSQLKVELEKSENIKIARRTVAKYRESLNILPSNRRKKHF